jgi:phage shock protein PspC (stress-responsive transcriptional regulator)
MCGGWAGRARGLRETLYRSAHAKGVCDVEEALSERWDVKKYFVTVMTVASAGASITVSPLVSIKDHWREARFPIPIW